ncbi:hypothetical protein Syun_018877 [Stephania yunnanensis]|uniref:Tryptophan synthase beta chain-like PALP domain-containing protein n=1 Tax=Stephania yunnanensis TaxID=152371 RepID=A0AAP0IU62_9MAGN
MEAVVERLATRSAGRLGNRPNHQGVAFYQREYRDFEMRRIVNNRSHGEYLNPIKFQRICLYIARDIAEIVVRMEQKSQLQCKTYAADISSIKEAQNRIMPFVHRTPVLSSGQIDSVSGRRLYFKCESFQKGGNHAAAVSLAAKLRGIPAHIVIPKNAPACKVENVRRYGGNVIWSEATVQSREVVAAKVVEETGGVLIHPFNDGRGGLISGVTLAAKAINSNIRILAAEPKGANDSAQSKAAGRIITLPETKTIADGLRAFLGDLTCSCGCSYKLKVVQEPVVRDLVDNVIVVDDKAIIEAMRMLYEVLKIVVEPSGAIGLAAIMSSYFQENPAWKDCNHIGIIVSGGNIDLGVLWESFKN